MNSSKLGTYVESGFKTGVGTWWAAALGAVQDEHRFKRVGDTKPVEETAKLILRQPVYYSQSVCPPTSHF